MMSGDLIALQHPHQTGQILSAVAQSDRIALILVDHAGIVIGGCENQPVMGVSRLLPDAGLLLDYLGVEGLDLI